MELTKEQQDMFMSDMGHIPSGGELDAAWAIHGHKDWDTIYADYKAATSYNFETKTFPLGCTNPTSLRLQTDDWKAAVFATEQLVMVYALKRLEAGKRI